MKNRRNVITVVAFTVLLIAVIITYSYQTASKEETIKADVTKFFTQMYEVTPETYGVILPPGESIEKQMATYKSYIEKEFDGLYTDLLYADFFIGDRYLMFAPQLASEKNLSMHFSNVSLTETSSDRQYKYYDFDVAFVLKDLNENTETVLVNKGQIKLKREFIRFKIDAVRYDRDVLVDYL